MWGAAMSSEYAQLLILLAIVVTRHGYITMAAIEGNFERIGVMQAVAVAIVPIDNLKLQKWAF